ncbi:Gfo/Idh/MocA family protein [Stutzerimonas nitrititolerans]|uniref:Gfo/Idh/MocA family protein n=1 Tax=Stutzerimonas nitrititolerans TaxID=2482751 RepID=UPI0028A780D2|nr:Gfo/Idh/MocA family oxidoreductase [Stutzerimonas nitrititolerans]
MKWLIAGTGSIGKRHISSIRNLRPGSEFVFLRPGGDVDNLAEFNAQVVTSFEAALALRPSAVVIATPTAFHATLLLEVIKSGLPVYIEKPVVCRPAEIESVRDQMARYAYAAPSMVGCNLRFLPSLRVIKDILVQERIGQVVRASFEVGQWLPDWRPGSDYRDSYSAKSEFGGGVVLDLIHELDLARWLLGEMVDVKALGAKVPALQIDSESVAGAVMRTVSGTIITVGLDYIARKPVRRYQLVGVNGSITWDLFSQTLVLSDGIGVCPIEGGNAAFDVLSTYEEAMAEFIVAIESGCATSQPLEEGLLSAQLALRIKEQL